MQLRAFVAKWGAFGASTLDGPAVLVGHSLGGYLSLAHAATRPGVARGIVVLNTGPGFRNQRQSSL